MKKKQSRLNIVIVLLILSIGTVIFLDVKFFREHTASFTESHPYVLSEKNDVNLDTGAENNTEKSGIPDEKDELPPPVSGGESTTTSGIFSEIFGG